MKVAIVYDSRTGTTQEAARAMGAAFRTRGDEVTVQSVSEADPAEVSKADLICVGSWTQGLFIILQHATRATMRFLESLGDLKGKEAVVFCTYKLATGSMLPRMAAVLERKGARVAGQYKFKGATPTGDFMTYASSS